jgi:hypothetical protein
MIANELFEGISAVHSVNKFSIHIRLSKFTITLGDEKEKKSEGKKLLSSSTNLMV